MRLEFVIHPLLTLNLDLTNFNKDTFEILQVHMDKMKSQREPLTLSFAFVQDQERIYHAVRERLLSRIPQQSITPQLPPPTKPLE
jgi:hypothetical protein